jgi:hypothetical protein
MSFAINEDHDIFGWMGIGQNISLLILVYLNIAELLLI